jgi:hypothetical protein
MQIILGICSDKNMIENERLIRPLHFKLRLKIRPTAKAPASESRLTGRSPRTLWAATFPRCDVGRNQSESPHTSLHHDHGLWLTLQGIFCCKCKPVPLVQRVQLPSARIAQYHLFYHGRWKDLRIRLIPRITPNHGTFKELNARFDSNDRTWR